MLVKCKDEGMLGSWSGYAFRTRLYHLLDKSEWGNILTYLARPQLNTKLKPYWKKRGSALKNLTLDYQLMKILSIGCYFHSGFVWFSGLELY